MKDQRAIWPNQMKPVPIGTLGGRSEPCRHGMAQSVCIGVVPWWTVATAGAAPALLVVGFLVAGMLQPVSYDSLRDTISALAARDAADPWVMTAAIAAVASATWAPLSG